LLTTGNVQAAADDLSDLPERHALFSDPVIPGSSSCGALFKHESVKMSGIEPVYRRPAIEPFAHISSDAFLSRQPNEQRNEAVITVAMDTMAEPMKPVAPVTKTRIL
jgi:hypothetical protein